MNTECYYNFIEIVNTGSISAASRKLFIAQPALSNQIKLLEEHFGTPLLQRGVRSVSLTDAGKIFYEFALAYRIMEDNLHKDISRCAKGAKGLLALGISATMPDKYISRLLLQFSEEYRDVAFQVQETARKNVVGLLSSGQVEVAIFRSRPEDIPPILQIHLAIQQRLIAVYHKESRWIQSSANAEPLSLDALRGVPLSCTHGLQQLLADACAVRGFAPNFQYDVSSRSSSLLWCKNDSAVAVIPEGSMNLDDACCRFFEDPEMYMTLYFCSLKKGHLSPAAKQFFAFCSEHPPVSSEPNAV